MFLIDTSVWIIHFNEKNGIDLKKLLKPEEIFICAPIYQEILQGIKNEKNFQTVQQILLNMEWIENPLTLEVYDSAISLYRIGRKSGLTIRSSIDCLIAACAINNGLTVLHRDRDYASIAKISTLMEKQI